MADSWQMVFQILCLCLNSVAVTGFALQWPVENLALKKTAAGIFFGGRIEGIPMKIRMKLILPLLASCAKMASFTHARPVSARGEDVAFAFQQKRIPDEKVQAPPQREMRAICGLPARDAHKSVWCFAESSFAALSGRIKAKSAGNVFVNELAGICYGRSRIYRQARIRPVRDMELKGRLGQ